MEGPGTAGGDTLEDVAAARTPEAWTLPWGGDRFEAEAPVAWTMAWGRDTLEDAAAAWDPVDWGGVALFERSIILRKVPSAARNRM